MKRTPLALAGLITAASAIATPGPNDFDWSTITPSRKLEYHPCYTEHQCARLIVPLDWLDKSNPHTVALAIVKLPAKVPDSDPAFGGSIFTNPGGPGGSGVTNLLHEGHIYQETADTETRKYEILSWDPRGVQFTSPRADCYEDLFARGTDAIQRMALGPIGASPDALRRQWARGQGYGRICAESAVNGSIIPFASTASVARDMVEMLDRIQELRDEEAEAARGVYAGENSQKPMQARGEKKPLRLQYWGFSYGSALGNTFASMFPGRVGRMIVDGIVDIDDYMAGGWLTNLQDTEELVEYFYKTCHSAGPDKCALARSSDTSSHDIRARVEDLVARLDAEPIHVLDGKLTHILTGYDAVNAFTRPLYSPYDAFPPLARRLDEAVRGNYTSLISKTTESLPQLDQACAHPNATAPPSSLGDGGQAVLCGDGEDSTGMSMAEYAAYAATLKEQSPTFAGYWSQIRLACTGWGVRPKWRYMGPFGTPAHDAAGVEGKPAAPLLFLSSRLDPVTPLRNARRMSRAHAGSVVVVQESAGHCTMATGSRCTTAVIRNYLEHGEVPAEETVCEADCGPWDEDTCLPSTRGVSIAGLGPPHEVHAW
ncbi:peptidase tripeptidyl-peptidase protein [Colletotrichum sojae]|uniref:Peptidase tripeptidyl-peptidase protein n=1 Tax=Colletotrichum sojae TaxID=2175907 RepID=A0A8H6IMN7_9PEZI|nr:peptidase tripeptidyl-peptidase protein [Colletotrichum sojae]